MRTTVGRVKQNVATEIDVVGIGSGYRDRGSPVEAVLEIRRLHGLNALKIRTQKARHTGLCVQPLDETVLRVDVHNVSSVSGRHCIFAVASSDGEPIGAADAAASQAIGWTAPRASGLKPAA